MRSKVNLDHRNPPGERNVWNLCSRFEDGSNGSVTACWCAATEYVPCDLCCRAHSGSSRPILLGEPGAVVRDEGNRRHLENGTSPPCSRRQTPRLANRIALDTGKSRVTFGLDGSSGSWRCCGWWARSQRTAARDAAVSRSPSARPNGSGHRGRHRRFSMTFACRSVPASSMRRRGSAADFLERSFTLE